MYEKKQNKNEKIDNTAALEQEEEECAKTDAGQSQDSELEKACRERDDLKDKYLRTYSDFNNYKKRMLAARADAIKDGQCGTIEMMLPVLDSFERAIEHIEECEEQSALADGMKMVYRQMRDVLEKLGVCEIPALGEVFDPNLHQAMQMVEPADGAVSGTVAIVVQKGYTQGDRVLRHSMVMVNK